MRLSPGIEWLLQNQKIHRKEKTESLPNLISSPQVRPSHSKVNIKSTGQGDGLPTTGGVEDEAGARVIAVGDTKVTVLPLRRKRQ